MRNKAVSELKLSASGLPRQGLGARESSKLVAAMQRADPGQMKGEAAGVGAFRRHSQAAVME